MQEAASTGPLDVESMVARKRKRKSWIVFEDVSCPSPKVPIAFRKGSAFLNNYGQSIMNGIASRMIHHPRLVVVLVGYRFADRNGTTRI